jgi:response regulator of citrate/malate metabolism
LKGKVYIKTHINVNIIGDNIMVNIGNKTLDKIVSILKHNAYGLTITDIVNKTNLSRSAVRTVLANLEGVNKVSIKQIGMAKVYSIKR